MLIKDLIDFGLSEKEAKAYLTLLELEVANVQDVARSANLNRSSTYVTLESLKIKGLVSISDKKSVRHYIATPPEAILRIAKDKAEFFENVSKRIGEIIPDMKALYKGTKKKPVIRVYEGMDGVITVINDTLTSREKLLRVWSAPANTGKIVYEHMPEYVKKRFNLGIKMIGIHPNGEMNEKLADNSPNPLDEYQLIPKEKFNFAADLAIYDNKITYSSKDNGGFAVIIESNKIADIMKSVFDLAYEEACRLNTYKKSK